MSLRTTVCSVTCTLIAATALAQETGQRPSQGGLGSQSQRSGSYSSSTHGQQSLRVSQQIIHAQVTTQDGQQLGQIEELIANPQTGKIEFAVVSKGDKLCPIPMQLLQPQPGASTSTTPGTTPTETTPSTTPGTGIRAGLGQKVTFVAQVDRQKLEQAPSFSKTQWPQMSQSWSQQIYSHFGVQPEAAGGTGSSSSSTQQGKSSSDPSKSDSSSDTEKRSKEKSEN